MEKEKTIFNEELFVRSITVAEVSSWIIAAVILVSKLCGGVPTWPWYTVIIPVGVFYAIYFGTMIILEWLIGRRAINSYMACLNIIEESEKEEK